MSVRVPGAMARSFPFHPSILESVKARDPQSAGFRMGEHLKDVETLGVQLKASGRGDKSRLMSTT